MSRKVNLEKYQENLDFILEKFLESESQVNIKEMTSLPNAMNIRYFWASVLESIPKEHLTPEQMCLVHTKAMIENIKWNRLHANGNEKKESNKMDEKIQKMEEIYEKYQNPNTPHNFVYDDFLKDGTPINQFWKTVDRFYVRAREKNRVLTEEEKKLLEIKAWIENIRLSKKNKQIEHRRTCPSRVEKYHKFLDYVYEQYLDPTTPIGFINSKDEEYENSPIVTNHRNVVSYIQRRLLKNQRFTYPEIELLEKLALIYDLQEERKSKKNEFTDFQARFHDFSTQQYEQYLENMLEQIKQQPVYEIKEIKGFLPGALPFINHYILHKRKEQISFTEEEIRLVHTLALVENEKYNRMEKSYEKPL